MTGDIIIVKHHFRWYDPASWISWLIRVFDKTAYNHCAIVLDYGYHRMVVEARGSGVYVATWENWMKHRPEKVWKIGTPKFSLPMDIGNRIMLKAGTRYDNESLFIWHPYRLLKGKWKGGTSSSGSLVCSEFVGLCFKEQFPEWYKLTTGDIIRSQKFDFE